MTNTSNQGGYKNLIAYKQSVLIYDFTDEFCKTYLDQYKDKRTIEQMVQAARSGKQNIVEGSLEKSLKMNIKLTGVARASLGELKEDYEDFLRTRKLAIWDKDDPRVWEIRNAYKTNKTNLTYMSYKAKPEGFANLMMTLISQDSFLLDRMIRALEEKFVNEGGYSENLFKKRMERRNEKNSA